jgi:transposase
MIPIRSGVRVWIATGHTDMRRGMNGLALQVQEGLKRDPMPVICLCSAAGAAI